MYQTLYRKYRPQTFDQVVGQKHIVQTLKGQVESNKLSHAYLFCGTRGTGKTTCARILAKAINCENIKDANPCNECQACQIVNSANSVDIVEIDAASNTGVENIRSLIEEVRYTPVELKKRVYIIDEVHMLSMQAFNALLKTLEEPPEHVTFILATTEIHKIPATIMSRCQRFDFKRISVESITQSIMEVAGKENINIQPEAAKIIAKMSDGAMRNAYSMLESCMGIDGVVTMEVMISRLGIANRESLIKLISHIASGNSAGAFKIISEIYESQNDFFNVLNEILKIYRDLLIIKSIPTCEMYLECYDNELSSLKEICQKTGYNELCTQSQEIQRLIENADRYGNTLRTAFEVTIMKLCEKPVCKTVSQSANKQAFASDSPAMKVNTPIRKSEDTPQNDVPSQQADLTSTKEKQQSAYSEYNLLRQEVTRRVPEIAPFFEKISTECSDGRLFIKCNDMLVKMIISNDVNLPKIKAIVGEISPEIKEVIITEKEKSKQQDEDF